MIKRMRKYISLFCVLTISAGIIWAPTADAASVLERIEQLGLASYFNMLPLCDRNEIIASLDGSYADDAEFLAAYKDAWDCVVTLIPESDSELLIDEDFENGIPSDWQTNRNPGTDTYESLSSDGSGEKAYYVEGGAYGGGNTYIKNDFGPREAIVSLYFYETEYEWSKSSFGVRISDALTFGVYGSSPYYQVYTDGSWKNTSVSRGEGWHRVVFDTYNQTKLKIYLDGEEIYEGDEEISYLQVGNLWNTSGTQGLDEWFIDEISAVGRRPLSWAEKFNATEVTEEVIEELVATQQADVFKKLPDCDRTDIINEMENNKPYESQADAVSEYERILKKVTQYDPEKLGLVFYEGFEDGITTDWESNKKLGINTNSIDNLDINGTEQKAAAFWGASTTFSNGEERVTGANQTMKRRVPENSYISLYFWDPMNDRTPFAGFSVNDNIMVGLYGATSNYLISDNGGASWNATDIERTAGWHRLVFDGCTKTNIITVYLDGTKITEIEGKTLYLEIGNFWNQPGFSYFGIDNITVARKFVPVAEDVQIHDNNTYLSVSYNYSHTGGKERGNTIYEWYKKNNEGEFEKIDGANTDKYYFKMPEDSGKTFKACVIPVDIDGIKGDSVFTQEISETYLSALQPIVNSVIINGDAVVGNTLTAVYTAVNATDASKDKYRWYLSDNGTEWTLLENETEKDFKIIGIDAIRKHIKCEVSVAGAEGSYSMWTSSNTILDQTPLVDMIEAVKASSETGKNATFLKLLEKCDSSFSAHAMDIKQKIAIKVLDSSISSEADYRKIVEGILDGSMDVGISDVDFAEKPLVDSYLQGGEVAYNGFEDLGGAEWARTAINALVRRKIISGKSETKFCPNDNITRAEFTVMLVRTFYGVNSTAQHNFTDIDSGSWYESYIATAHQSALVFGKDDGSFGPNDAITREEMAVLASRVIAAGKCQAEDIREYMEFDDSEFISEYAYDHVVSMYKKGIMSGIGSNSFGAQDFSTRAMAAQMIYVMLGSPIDAQDIANGDITIEDFEDYKWIFTQGHPENESVEPLQEGNIAYSGANSVVFKGLSAATVDAGENRFFRIMYYDANGHADPPADGHIRVEGDKKDYAVGAYSASSTEGRGFFYQVYADGKWSITGIPASVGWHEFALDFSREGYVDAYIDGVVVKSFSDSETKPLRVVIGNIETGFRGKVKCYGDDFVMAKSKKIFESAMSASAIGGNSLIRTTPINYENLPENLHEAVGILNGLGILAADSDGNICVDNPITKEEFVYLLSGMQNESRRYMTAKKQYFTDVELDRWSAGYIEHAAENGLVNTEDTKFYPEESMQTNEAIRLMLVLLGYARLSETMEADRLIEIASTAGITKGITTVGRELTIGDAIRLLYNTLDANMLEVTLSNNLEYKTTDVTYLSYIFDVYEVEDAVNGIYGAEFTESTVLDEGEMLIGKLVVQAGNKLVSNFNGTYVKAYVHADEDEYKLVYIANKGKGKVLQLDAHDILLSKNKEITYEFEGREKKVRIAETMTVNKNGAYLFAYDDNDFMPAIGYVRLIDNDSDNIYEKAIIMDYRPVLWGYNPSTKLIRDGYTGEDLSLENAKTITRHSSGRAYPEMIENGSVVLVARADNGIAADILTDMELVSGSITRRDEDGIYIDDNQYYLSDVFASYVEKKGLDILAVGAGGKFVIDSFGTIIGQTEKTQDPSVFAYIVRTYKDEYDDVYLKLFTDKGVFITVKCNERLTIDDTSRCNPELLVGVPPQLIRYKLKSDGTLSKVEFADTAHKDSDELKGSDEFWLYKDTTVWFRNHGYGFGSSLYTTSDTPVMLVPATGNEKDTELYRMSTVGAVFSQKTYSYKAYNANEFNYPDIILLEVTDNRDIKLPKDISVTRMFIVESLKTMLDDNGDIRDIITGWEGGKKVSYYVAEGVDFNQLKKDKGYTTRWKRGDAFFVVLNEKDEIFDAYYYTTENDQKAFIHSEDEDSYTDLSTFDFAMETIHCLYNKVDDVGSAIRITDGRNKFVIQDPYIATYVFDRETGAISAGTKKDIVPGSEIFAFIYHGRTMEIFVYVN